MGYGLTFLVLLALVLVERYWVRARTGRATDWLNLAANLNSGHLVMWLLRGVEVAGYAAVLAHASVGWVGSWPPAAQWIAGFVGWDLAFYTMHYFHHRIPFLWKIHAVHHAGSEMSLSLAIRNGWLSSLSDFPFMLPLALLGVPLHVFLAVSSVHYAAQFLNHVDSAVVDRLGVLDRVMVTPSNHRAHHGLQPLYHNCNFGSMLLVWDRLFGTYQREEAGLARLYGLDGVAPSGNPLAMNLPVLAPMFRRWRHCAVPPAVIGAGAVLLFCWVGYAVEREPAPGQPWLDGLVVASSIALGMAADGLCAGVLAWLGLAVGLAVWTVVFAPLPAPAVLVALALGHACYAVLTSRDPQGH